MNVQHLLQAQTPQGVQTFPLLKPELAIGRARDNDVVLNDDQVSGHHARLLVSAAGYHIVDLGSRNGTFLNGARLQPQMPCPVQPGDTLQVGQCQLSLQPLAASAPIASERSAQTNPSLPSGQATIIDTPQGGGAYGVLQVRLARGGWDEHPFFKPEISLGRTSDNDFILDSPQISGHHLHLAISADGSITATDQGSLNGTRLNGRPLPPRIAHTLRPEDVLQVDEFLLSVRRPTPQSPAPPALAERVRISLTLQPALAVFAQGRLIKAPITQPVMEIGCAPNNDIVIAAPAVADHHARLQQTGDGFVIQDLGSASGLTYNGQRVQQQLVHAGDVVYLGPEVAVQMRAWLGFAPAAASARGAIAATRPIMLAKQDNISIGRAQDNAIVLDHPMVSHYHALIERLGTRYRIKDLKSTNGVFVNGKRIEHEAWLAEGDEIRIGPVKLSLAAEGIHQVAEEGVRLDVMRLNKWVTKSRNLLQDISLSIYPQEFVAIVGLSGAGKSMLMDAINGFRPATHGTVMVNGTNLYQNMNMFRSDMGYVPQKDIVHTELTVYKALDYSAQLRMPADTSSQERRARIAQVLEELDLTERKDLLIHKLSGGQLKRVSIGVELLTEPRLFFLDEPTSGLDPGTEYTMMRLLRKLADQGRTILLVTHATKNVMMCDKVIIMVRGGHMAFYGLPEEALVYFDQYRTEHERRIKDMEFDDIYTVLEDEKRGAPEDWDKRYRQSPVYRKYVVGRLQELRDEKAVPRATRARGQQLPRVNILRQFLVLTRRYMDLVMRDRLLLFVLLGVMPFIGLLVVLISQSNWLVGDSLAEVDRQLAADVAAGSQFAWYGIVDSTRRLLFIMGLASVLLGLFASGFEIVKEWSIYQRERMVILRIVPYLASKVVVLAAFALVQCFLLILVVGLKVHMPAAGAFLPAPLEIYITLVLGTLAAILFGLFISALVPNPNSVIYILLVVLFLQVIFAGVIFDLPDAAAHVSDLTLTRWTIEGLGTSVDMDQLNELTRNRFAPGPITQTVSMEVERPSPDWTPVTVVTVTRNIQVPGPIGAARTVPMSVPQVTVNPMITVTQLVTRTVGFTPEPEDIPSPRTFQLSFAHTPWHLFWDWFVLTGFGAVFGLGTVIVLRRKDLG